MSWVRAKGAAPAAWLVAAAVVAFGWGCGEVETVKLAAAPDPSDFAGTIQPLLEQLGCSANGGCHSVVAGNFQFIEDPNPAQRDANYLSAVGKLDLADPARSDLLALLVKGTDGRTHPRPPYCFESVDSCAYRKILAWADWEAPGDLRPQDVPCDEPDEACP